MALRVCVCVVWRGSFQDKDLVTRPRSSEVFMGGDDSQMGAGWGAEQHSNSPPPVVGSTQTPETP